MLKTNPPRQSARKNLLGKRGIKVEKDFKPITRLGEGSNSCLEEPPSTEARSLENAEDTNRDQLG